MLLVAFAVVIRVGVSAHRWMWEQAQLLSYRAAMQDLTTTVRASQFKAFAQQRMFMLRVDAPRGQFQLVSMAQRPGELIEHVERTMWLPDGLEISEAPTILRVFPSGGLASSSIVVVAPAHNLQFHLQTSETGEVQLHEESTL